MSVAFRRESDEEHLEPKFELPIPTGPNLVTERGLALIQAKVIELETLVPTLSDETVLNAIKRELRYWRTRQVTANLVPMPDGEAVEFGCTVKFLQNGKVRSITIVGDDEANPAANLISFSAPLVQAMLHAEPGDYVAFAGRPDEIEIIAIHTTRD